MAYKNKYLRVTSKKDRLVVRRIDVAHLNKKGRDAEWDELDKEYPPAEYITCYEESGMPLPLK
jgi:hypothetical protein